MKRILPILLALVLLIAPLCGLPLEAKAETYVPSRTINLVYDDSGSMIRTGGQYVDTWCQAKYAMEVVAAMLGERDVLNIYYMSDYDDGSTAAPPRLTLQGSKDPNKTAANVKQIHDLVTDAGDTPFDAVKKAYQDLRNVSTDEQWLVVLTDGAFGGSYGKPTAVKNYYLDCVGDGKTKVAMLSMGSEAPSIDADPGKGIYFEKAENTTVILPKLTKICNQIFQNNVLPMNGLKSSFNVPMSELIVFAQGKEVKIESITDDKGNTYTPTSNVKVQYSSTATDDRNYPTDKVKVADNLMGYVATFACDFEPGAYTFNVSGADTVEVYYKPNVTIAAYLYDDDGEEVTAQEQLVSGTYRVEYGFLNGTNGQKVTDTSLLGNITYSSTITNTTKSGEANTQQVANGDKITIVEGTLQIDVQAQFLEYNTVRAQLSYEVFSRNDLVFQLEQNPTYKLGTEGFENGDEPMVLTVVSSNNGQVTPLTEEQWKLLGTPTIKFEADLDPFRVERVELGKYHLYPNLKDGDPMQTAVGDVQIQISGSFVQDISSYQGKLKETVRINSDITDWERFMDWLEENWLKLTICLGILLLILGYIPPFKKYLPKKLKSRPLIDCSPTKIGVKPKEASGKYRKDLISTLIPYKAETGAITFTPAPKKTVKVRAAGRGAMHVTNAKVFAGKSEFEFNGDTIPEGKTTYRITASMTLGWKDTKGNMEYTCYPNQSKH